MTRFASKITVSLNAYSAVHICPISTNKYGILFSLDSKYIFQNKSLWRRKLLKQSFILFIPRKWNFYHLNPCFNKQYKKLNLVYRLIFLFLIFFEKWLEILYQVTNIKLDFIFDRIYNLYDFLWMLRMCIRNLITKIKDNNVLILVFYLRIRAKSQ